MKLNMSNVSWSLAVPSLDSLYSNTLVAGTYTVSAQDYLQVCFNDTTFTVVEKLLPTIFTDTIVFSYEFYVSDEKTIVKHYDLH